MKPIVRFALYNIYAFAIPFIAALLFLLIGGIVAGQNFWLIVPLALIFAIMCLTGIFIGGGLLGVANFGFYRLSLNKFTPKHKLYTLLFSGLLLVVVSFIPVLLGIAAFGLVFLIFMLIGTVSSLIGLWLAMTKTELRVE